MEGVADGQPAARTAVLRATGTYLLSGVIAALATRALLDGQIPPGVHFAADVIEPDPAIAELKDSPGVEALEVFAGGEADGDDEEGAL